MFRWLTICLLLCAGTFVLMSLALKETPLPGSPKEDGNTEDTTPVGRADPAVVVIEGGSDRGKAVQPLVIYDSRMLVAEEQNVPAEREGKILFVATEVSGDELNRLIREGKYIQGVGPTGEEMKRLIQEGKYIPGALDYLAVENSLASDPFEISLPGDTRKYHYRTAKDQLLPDKVRVVKIPKLFRKLEVGDRVKRDDLLALINPVLALDDMYVKMTKFDAAEADREASAKTRDEARKRWDAMARARRDNIRAVSDDEFRGGQLTYERYIQEEIAKAATVRQTSRELAGAETVLRMHEIRANISGVVKVLYKSRGEAIKALEPVLQIQNTDMLRVEGVVGVEDARQLRNEMLVSVEPTQPESPRLVLRGHTQEIHSVAVSKGPKVQIVSGGEDKSLRVWDGQTGQQLWAVLHSSPVRAVACTPPAATLNLVLAGNADGSARLFNLGNMKEAPVEFGPGHISAINCVAFSPDGTLCATGGDDRAILLWKMTNNEGQVSVSLLHSLKAAHKAAITSLQFIPGTETGQEQFLSVGGDRNLSLWTMDKEKMPVKTMDYDQRSNDVLVLGTDGKSVLFDQGKEIQLRSLKDRTVISGRLRNPPGAGTFTTMALFSPDGKTILTNSASDNHLQLWRTPPAHGRGSELRQYVWNNGAVTCGAFAPDNTFLVTGTHDQQVLVWNMPSQAEVEKRLVARIKSIEKSTESSARQVVRISAELDETPSWVTPGGTATMVIAPEVMNPQP